MAPEVLRVTLGALAPWLGRLTVFLWLSQQFLQSFQVQAVCAQLAAETLAPARRALPVVGVGGLTTTSHEPLAWPLDGVAASSGAGGLLARGPPRQVGGRGRGDLGPWRSSRATASSTSLAPLAGQAGLRRSDTLDTQTGRGEPYAMRLSGFAVTPRARVGGRTVGRPYGRTPPRRRAVSVGPRAPPGPPGQRRARIDGAGPR